MTAAPGFKSNGFYSRYADLALALASKEQLEIITNTTPSFVMRDPWGEVNFDCGLGILMLQYCWDGATSRLVLFDRNCFGRTLFCGLERLAECAEEKNWEICAAMTLSGFQSDEEARPYSLESLQQIAEGEVFSSEPIAGTLEQLTVDRSTYLKICQYPISTESRFVFSNAAELWRAYKLLKASTLIQLGQNCLRQTCQSNVAFS